MSALNEFPVEDAALMSFEELPPQLPQVWRKSQFAPGKPVAERNSFVDVVEGDRFRETSGELSCAIAEEISP